MIFSLIAWIFRQQMEYVTEPHDFTHFSQTYCAIICFSIQVFICMKKDLSVFIRLMQYGSYFIITLMMLNVLIGIYGFTNTEYQILPPSNQSKPNVDDNLRFLYLFNTNFSPLAGQLGIGYFLHTVAVPIIKNNEKPENNERDVLFGYILVCFSYICVGTMGYIGY